MRYERKYKVSDLHHHVILQNIRMHPAGLRKIYPDRQINNIYFDSTGLQCYHDNVDGVAERKKFRVRWYGDDVREIENPNLEIKYRINEVGAKKIFPVSDFELFELKNITKEVSQILDKKYQLTPVLLNSYNRSYFGTPDGMYRITVDRNLRYFSFLSANRFIRYTTKENAVVMEIKYEMEDDIHTERVTQHFPLRQTKSSKYVTGVQMTGWL
ncbi:MAG: polyphosphate polymerase domain-containing protein [Saprospiraceae bacterium]